MTSRPRRALSRGHGQAAPCKPASSIRLEIEILEDRLVLSSTILGSDDITHEFWAQQTFTLNDVTHSTIDLVGDAGTLSSPSSQLIGLDQAQAAFPYTGAGYTIAILDTGVNYNLAALGGGWGVRVVAGWDFANNDADPMDDNGHGTAVAGIIGSSDATSTGIAPNVNIVALKVIGADGSGSFGNVERALQWVVANQAQYNIVAVNMSLGSGNYTADPFRFLDDEFEALLGSNVFIAVASGNSYYGYGSQQGLAYPAVSSQVVSVGAVWTGDFGFVAWLDGARDYTTAQDRITSFTQRHAELDLLAPGAMITCLGLTGGYKIMAGTSMASPMVAGAAVLIHQALDANGLQALTDQNDILSIMQTTGATVIDGDDENDNVVNTGLAFKRLDVNAALKSITPAVNHPPVLGVVADQTVGPGQALTITLPGSDADGDPLTYQAQVEGASGSSLAYELKTQLGLQYGGSYYTNIWGAGEKWLMGANLQWYCLMPNGELRRWAGTMQATLLASNLIASLGAAYYQDPSLLWNASPSSGPALSVVVSGNKLTLSAPAGATGTYQVNITVSDGQAQASQSFKVTVASNTPPTLGTIGNVVLPAGTNTTTITLPASDADNDALTFTAGLTGLSKLAVQTQQQLGLSALGFSNLLGLGEKWFSGKGWQLYTLSPSGELRLWAGSISGTLSAANLVATFDSSFYSDPSKLLSPVNPTFTFSGNQLTIATPAGYTGSFGVQVSVTDGKAAASQTFTVSIGVQASTSRVHDVEQDEGSRPAATFLVTGTIGALLPDTAHAAAAEATQCRDYFFSKYASEEESSYAGTGSERETKAGADVHAKAVAAWVADPTAADDDENPFGVSDGFKPKTGPRR